MHHTHIAYGVAGMLAITLALGGCRGASTAQNDSSKAPAETMESSASPVARVVYWEGKTDTDDTFYFFEDQVSGTGSLTILRSDETVYSIEGSLYIATDGTTTITHVIPLEEDEYEYEDTKKEPETETYSFKITDENETSLLIDAGENGKGTLKPLSEEDYECALASINGDDESFGYSGYGEYE